MYLFKALRFSEIEIAAFVGAGGKTSAIFTVAYELAHQQKYLEVKTVFVTTTTHLGEWQTKYADHNIHLTGVTDLLEFDREVPSGIILFFSGIENGRLTRVDDETLGYLRELSTTKRIPLLIEADGSRGLPLKAPSDYEPVIPEYVNSVVVVAGLSGLGKPLTREWVHRPEIFAEVSGLSAGENVTVDALCKLVLSCAGGLKNIPSTARKVLLLSQADDGELQAQAREIASLAQKKYQSIVVTSIDQHLSDTISARPEPSVNIHGVFEQIGCIILAGGSSSRFGTPKQLLKWGSDSFVKHLSTTAINSGLSPVVVVLGSSADEIMKEITDLPILIVNNEEWNTGQSSSIRAGMKHLPAQCGGVIFLNADQPQTPVQLIRKLIEEHRISLAPIIAPQIDGRRGNPVLFDRVTFDALMTIEGDIGGRAIFNQYPIRWVPWLDPDQLVDIDTPEQYQKFLELRKHDEE